MAELSEPPDHNDETVVVATRPGPVIRLATVCESVIEEIDTHTTTIVRMIDSVEFNLDEIARGDTTLPGYTAFMGYQFPGDDEEVDVSILVATDSGDVIGISPRKMQVQGPARAFAIAIRLGGLRIPKPGQYVLALAYQNQEIARVYLRVLFESPAPASPTPDES